MKESFPAESKIREYLLGRLDDQPETEDQLSRQMIFDDELSEIVDSVEDEIIEDYLDGTLDESDKKAVEEYFLRPPERREKLRFARLLRDRFAKNNKAVAETGQPRESRPVVVFRPRLRQSIYIGLAAAVLLVVSCVVYRAGVRRGVQSQLEISRNAQSELEKQLEQERQNSADVAKRLEKHEPLVAVATFIGRFRDTGPGQVVKVWPGTQQVGVEIQMPGSSGKAYDVVVQSKSGNQIWAQAGVKASSDSLAFEMLRRLFTAGDYCVVVSSQPGRYCFQIKVEK